MSKAKILFVDHTPFIGGAQICLKNHIKYLNKRRFEPILVIDKNSKFKSFYNDLKIKVYKIDLGILKRFDPKIIFNLISSIKEFNKLINKLKPEVVLTNTTRALIISLLSNKNFRLISYIRDYDYPKWLVSLARLKVDKFLMVSKSINEFYKGNRNKFEITYLGSDLDKKLSKVKKAEVERFNKKFDLKRTDIKIGYVGRLVEWKGIDILIKAFQKIDRKNIKLLIFGSGKNQKGSNEENLKSFVEENNLEERVKFIGFLENQALIYKLINIFVLPSKEPEPFATNVIEAAFAKLPIIATNIGGTGEFIKNNKNGLLIKHNDTNAIYKALLRLIEGRDLREKLGKNAYLDAQNFSEEKLARKLEKIYLNT